MKDILRHVNTKEDLEKIYEAFDLRNTREKIAWIKGYTHWLHSDEFPISDEEILDDFEDLILSKSYIACFIK